MYTRQTDNNTHTHTQVAKDGYGVSYIIQGDYVMFFHVSSFISCPETDSRRFTKHIEESLAEMRGLFLDSFQ